MFGFLKKKKSAKIAKDRLTIAIMSDRGQNVDYPFLEDLKKDILAVVKKYTEVKNITIRKEVELELEALSIEIELEK